MTVAPLEVGRARLVVEARLGRPPQDMLEAAVVLEAWAGIPADRALATARALMAGAARTPERSVGRLPRPSSREGIVLEGTAFIVTVVAIAGWVAPLRASLGAATVEDALIVALPLTLALQWALRSRYLGRPHGLTHLAAARRRLLLGVAGLVGAATLLVGVAGTAAALLAVIWSGGSILIRRRWPAAYVLTVLGATAGMLAGARPLVVLAAGAGMIVVAVGWALHAPAARADRSFSMPWPRTVQAAAIGGGLGLMLILDRTVSWTQGEVPALFLLPSAVGSFWAGYHLHHLEQAIPGAASGIAVSDARHSARAWRPPAVLAAAVARLLLAAGALSAVLLTATPWVGSSARSAGVLSGFALLALATLLVGLLDAIGHGRFALIAVACAAAGEEIVALGIHEPSPGLGLIVAGAVGIVLLLPMAIALLSRPAGTLATALWIP